MRRRQESENDDLNIWVAFTDLMSNSFLIINLFLITSFLINVTKSKSGKNEVKDHGISISTLERRNSDLENRNRDLQQEIGRLKPSILKESDTPPIIFLSDSKKIRFKSGSAGLQGQQMLQEFDKKDGLIDKIQEKANSSYGINLVEIIGHTDSEAVSRNPDKLLDLDNDLERVANNSDINKLTVDDIAADSNADLGLMRAVEIMRILRYHQKNNGKLKGLKFRAYSAAQLVPPKLSDNENPKDDNKRRIEIRFTRLDEKNMIIW